MGKVSITKTDSDVKKGLTEALARIGGLQAFVGCGDSVLLKPNLNGEDGATNKELVEALLQLLSDVGVRKLAIGEATFGSAGMTDRLFRQTGFAEMARAYGAPLINLNRSEAVDVDVANPLVLETIRIAREAWEADAIINIPNMKVHYATGITLALKNLKGILVGAEKRRFHEAGLDKAIVDLNNTVRPALHIVDAIMCMERMGPRGGDPVDLGLILAGASAGEVDVVGSRIMGFDLPDVKHLQLFLAANRIDPEGIEIAGERIETVRRPFVKVEPEKILPAQLHLHNTNACSACENALLLSCRMLERPPSRRVDLFMGAPPEDAASADGIRIAFGSCCAGGVGFDKVIRGCPPYPFALMEYLRSIGAL